MGKYILLCFIAFIACFSQNLIPAYRIHSIFDSALVKIDESFKSGEELWSGIGWIKTLISLYRWDSD